MRVAEFSYCSAAGTVPHFVWRHGLPAGPAVINWTSRAQVNRAVAIELRVHYYYPPPPLSLASVVGAIQAALRMRRRGLRG